MSRQSKLSSENKLVIYKTIIKPIWTYGIQLWGTAAKSHILKMEATQSIILRTIVNEPWYVKNEELRKDLQVPSVDAKVQRMSERYKTSMTNHPSPLASTLYENNVYRRLRYKYKRNRYIHIHVRTTYEGDT